LLVAKEEQAEAAEKDGTPSIGWGSGQVSTNWPVAGFEMTALL